MAGSGARVDQLAHVGLRQLHRQQADLRAVGVEDVREAGRHDRLVAVVLQRPGRVLARAARPEVAAGRQDRGAVELDPVQREAGLAEPVPEQELAEAGALDPLQELLGDDLVGVDVGAVERRHLPGYHRHRLHTSSRTSVSRPVTAAAAAIAGESRCVRPPRPCRPSKLRLEVDAQRSPGASDVRVHAQAHRAAGAAPVEPGRLEHLVQTLTLSLSLNRSRIRGRPSPARSTPPAGRARSRRRRGDPRCGRSCTSPGTPGRLRSRSSACPAAGPCR